MPSILLGPLPENGGREVHFLHPELGFGHIRQHELPEAYYEGMGRQALQVTFHTEGHPVFGDRQLSRTFPSGQHFIYAERALREPETLTKLVGYARDIIECVDV